jgi:hypothetical protein
MHVASAKHSAMVVAVQGRCLQSIFTESYAQEASALHVEEVVYCPQALTWHAYVVDPAAVGSQAQMASLRQSVEVVYPHRRATQTETDVDKGKYQRHAALDVHDDLLGYMAQPARRQAPQLRSRRCNALLHEQPVTAPHAADVVSG